MPRTHRAIRLTAAQDVQGWSYDYQEEFFAERVHTIRRQAPDAAEVHEIAGGCGARFAQMETEPERDTIVFTGMALTS